MKVNRQADIIRDLSRAYLSMLLLDIECRSSLFSPMNLVRDSIAALRDSNPRAIEEEFRAKADVIRQELIAEIDVAALQDPRKMRLVGRVAQ